MNPDQLQRFDIASGLDHDGRAALANILTEKSVAEGSVVTARGGPARSVFFVLGGAFTASVAAQNGREAILDTLGPGRVFGEWSALDGGARVRSVRADCPGRLAVARSEAFDEWLTAHPVAMRTLLSEMAGQMRLFSDRLFEVSVHDLDTRVRRFLARMLIAEGQFRAGGVLDPAPAPERIGGHVGARGDAVVRVLAELQAAGVIEFEGQVIRLRDAGRLEYGV